MATLTLPIETRFFNYVNKSNDPDGCWLWTGFKIKTGYGRFWQNGHGVAAHRFAYEHFVGEIQEGLFVCHKCDNPQCVNPKHLWLGTHQQNMDDRQSKHRQAVGDRTRPETRAKGDRSAARLHPELRQGERNGRAKLTEGDVRDIRASYAEGNITYKELAEEYGVNPTLIGFIIRRVNWKLVS